MRPSLVNLTPPGSPGGSMLMQALVRTPDRHEPVTIRSPLLKPSYRTCLQVAGLQELATTPGIYYLLYIVYTRKSWRSHRSPCRLQLCTGRFVLGHTGRRIYFRYRAENGIVQNGNPPISNMLCKCEKICWQERLTFTHSIGKPSKNKLGHLSN